MAGYYRGPECVVLSLTSLAGGNIESEVSRRELVLDTPYGYGSKAIFKRVSGLELDPAFEKYRAIAAYRHHTIRRAVQIAENAVRAHCDPVARDLDPKAYAIVGGHIHVAQITAGEGFSWAIPPLP